MSEFQVVSKKVRKPKAQEVKETILVCQDAFDWEEGFNFVGELTTVKDLEAFGEKKRLLWYFHGLRDLYRNCTRTGMETLDDLILSESSGCSLLTFGNKSKLIPLWYLCGRTPDL
jgi:hypothetical protein